MAAAASYAPLVVETVEHLRRVLREAEQRTAVLGPMSSDVGIMDDTMPKVPPRAGPAPKRESVGPSLARTSGQLTPSQFATKWTGNTRTERAAAQEHFIDLCRMLDFPTPNEADPHGNSYAFEKGAGKGEGGEGFADVWKRGHFGWEYKRKKKSLSAAFGQLSQYRAALENPPLLVVCDLDRFEVHTNFTNTREKVYRFTLDDLATKPQEPLRILRAVMGGPGVTPAGSPGARTDGARGTPICRPSACPPRERKRPAHRRALHGQAGLLHVRAAHGPAAPASRPATC